MDPIKRHIDMGEFDKLVLRAARIKRKDIVERKAAQIEKKEYEEYLKMNFDSTVQELLDGLEASPWYTPRKKKSIENAWRWDCSGSQKDVRCSSPRYTPRKMKSIENAWRWDCSGSQNDVLECNGQSRRHTMDF